MKYTTTRLKHTIASRYRLHERSIRHALEGCAFIVALVLMSRLLAPPAPAQPITGAERNATTQPVIVIQRETQQPAPTLTPAPTPEPVVVEVQAPPQVIYVEVPQAPQASQDGPGQAEEAAPVVEAAPTPAAVYSVLTEREQNIQQHYIDIPTREPMQGDDVTQQWVRSQWESEHCSGSGEAKVCR